MPERIVELNEGNFDKLTAKGKWIIDLWAEWCGPCKIVEPIFKELSQEYKDVNFGKVNVDKEQEIAERFDVMSIPTMLFLKDGEQIDRVIGAVSKNSFKEKIEESF